ncbi:hypothetical protein HPB49_012650 [Dermacentor silvarum]|uniref:Uncharacterized protein n=1 Tax=Dermacentor silvarum TaxID=543639 RepID=A0ACB8C9E6_DERSI|nr:hypothetical protein HPB49_012650 [Dermacentor silvarum]
MEQLRIKRGFVRRAITKAISTIDALLSDEATPVPVLHLHLKLVLAKQEELVAFYREIQETLMDADLEADFSTAFEYERKVSFTKTSVRLATEHSPRILVGPTTQPASPPYPAASSPHPDSRPWRLSPTLPCQSCTSRALLGSDLAYLSWSAKKVIESIRLAEANYDVAVKVLSDRFDRCDMLVDDHLDHLLAIAPIRSSADLDKLRNVYDEITSHTSALEGLRVSADEYAAVLRRVIMKNLPRDLGILCHQRLKEASLSNHDDTAAVTEDKSQQVKQLITFLRIQFEAREEGTVDQASSSTSQHLHQRETRHLQWFYQLKSTLTRTFCSGVALHYATTDALATSRRSVGPRLGQTQKITLICHTGRCVPHRHRERLLHRRPMLRFTSHRLGSYNCAPWFY